MSEWLFPGIPAAIPAIAVDRLPSPEETERSMVEFLPRLGSPRDWAPAVTKPKKRKRSKPRGR